MAAATTVTAAEMIRAMLLDSFLFRSLEKDDDSLRSVDHHWPLGLISRSLCPKTREGYGYSAMVVLDLHCWSGPQVSPLFQGTKGSCIVCNT